MAAARRRLARVGFGLCARPGLSQGAPPAPAAARGCACQRGRAVRPSRVHRFRTGARGRARDPQRSRLARQAHAGARSRRRLHVLSRRDLPRRRDAGDAADERALRQLHRVPRHLSDACDRRSAAPRCAPLHLVSDHRAPRADPGRAAACDRQSHLRLRRLPARVPVESLRAAQPAARLRRARRVRRSDLARAVAVGRGRVPCAHRRQRDPPHRPRALAAQRRRRTRQRVAHGARCRDGASDRRALQARADAASPLVREHIAWALAQRPGAQPPIAAATASQSGMPTIASSVDTVTSPATNGPSPPMRAAST